MLDFNCKALLHEHHPQTPQRGFKTPPSVHTGSQPGAGERGGTSAFTSSSPGSRTFHTFVLLSFTVAEKSHCWRHQGRTPSPLAPVLQMPDGGR